MSGTTNVSINVLCDQRKKLMLFTNPQFRFTPVSPYNGNFSKFQIDMRRKAEILKYNNTTSSSKTNNLTKAEKFAQVVKGSYRRPGFQNRTLTILDATGNYNTITVGYPDKLIISDTTSLNNNAVQIVGSKGYYIVTVVPNGLLVNCSLDRLIPTPTSSCGIPGPIVHLIDDENVPLYNFTNNSINNAAYSENKNKDSASLEVLTNKNVLLTTTISSNLGFMLVKSTIEQSFYTFKLKVPIGVYATNSTGLRGGARITINNIKLEVKYSNTSIGNSEYTVSLSNNLFNSPINVQYTELSTPVNGYNYFAFIDTVVISNILLITNPGYVYDFNLTVNIDSNNTQYDFTNSKIFANCNNSVFSSELILSI
jgi:hypothetical protein